MKYEPENSQGPLWKEAKGALKEGEAASKSTGDKPKPVAAVKGESKPRSGSNPNFSQSL